MQNALELPSRVLTGGSCEGSVVLRQPLPSVVEERRGLLILAEQSSFRAFYHDLHEEGDAFLTLLRAKKLWLMCNLSNDARELDRLGRDRREAASRTRRYLQSLTKTMAKQVFWGLLEPGQSLYLPYAGCTQSGQMWRRAAFVQCSLWRCLWTRRECSSSSLSLISTPRWLVGGSSQVEVNKVDYCR